MKKIKLTKVQIKLLVLVGLILLFIIPIVTNLKVNSVKAYQNTEKTSIKADAKKDKKNSDSSTKKNAEDKKDDTKKDEKKDTKKDEKKDTSSSTPSSSSPESSQEQPATPVAPTPPPAPTSVTVTIYIDVTTLTGNNLNLLRPELQGYVPQSGYVLGYTSVTLPVGSNVFDALSDVTRSHRIHMEYQGAGDNIYNSVYIQGINYLYEKNAGSGSGWMYSVNGNFPNVGASAYTLNDGDTIRWVYTTNLGCDLGAC